MVRLPQNPLLTASSPGMVERNINGPSVIRVPSWVPGRLGNYYLYFGHHQGKTIRLAYADSPEGPWTVHEPGVLTLEQAGPFRRSIAAPDVHIEQERREIRMYFRGDGSSTLATSHDGRSFQSSGVILTRSYLRVFTWRGTHYGICKAGNSGWGELLRSSTGRTAFESRGRFLRRMRHAAVLLRGDRLIVFYSRVGDRPERILAATVSLTDDWTAWVASRPVEVLRPRMDYEGVDYRNHRSRYGPATGVRQLRDPCVLDDEGRLYLFYSIAGEMGIAAVTLTMEIGSSRSRGLEHDR